MFIFYVCLCCCCVVHKVTVGKKLESTSSFLGCHTVGLMGLKHISYVGFSIENKMLDLKQNNLES